MLWGELTENLYTSNSQLYIYCFLKHVFKEQSASYECYIHSKEITFPVVLFKPKNISCLFPWSTSSKEEENSWRNGQQVRFYSDVFLKWHICSILYEFYTLKNRLGGVKKKREGGVCQGFVAEKSHLQAMFNFFLIIQEKCSKIN